MATFPTETRITRTGVALALYPGDDELAMQVQRAPDSSGSPDTGNAEVIGVADPGSQHYVDLVGAGSTLHYRYRHITPSGATGDWTRWVSATPKKLPDVLPNVPAIAALDRWATDIEFSPDSTEAANAVEWTAGDVILGNGQTYNLNAGSSATYGDGVIFWVYFDPGASETELQDTQTFGDLIGDGIIPLAICETTSDGTGELTIAPTLGLGNINASRIFALELSAIAANLGTITAGIIQNAASSPTAGVRVDSAITLPASFTRYLDLAATGSDPFLKHGSVELRADGSATYSGDIQSLHLDPSASGILTGTTAEGTLRTITLPADRIGAGGGVRIQAALGLGGTGGNKEVRVRFAGNEVASGTFGTGAIEVIMEVTTLARSTSSQLTLHHVYDTNGGSISTTGTSVDTTVDQDFTITVQLDDSGDAAQLDFSIAEILAEV